MLKVGDTVRLVLDSPYVEGLSNPKNVTGVIRTHKVNGYIIVDWSNGFTNSYKEIYLEKVGFNEGDIITDGKEYRKVLGVAGQTVFTSYSRESIGDLVEISTAVLHTYHGLRRWRTCDKDTEPEEMTMQQVCEALGKNIKIKK